MPSPRRLERARGETDEQQAAGDDVAEVGQQHEPAAIEPVRPGAGEPAQCDPWRHGEEGEQGQRRGVPGLAEDRDADRKPADLAAKQRDRLRQQQHVVGPEPDVPGERLRRVGRTGLVL
jgi:hypothetical protein